MNRRLSGILGFTLTGAFALAVGCSDDDAAVPPATTSDAGVDAPPPPPPGDGGNGKPTADIQILQLSDWHGQLDPISENDAAGNPQIYGGLGALATYFAEDRAKNPNTIVLTAGDAFGATPALSGFFGDEPAVKGLNLLGLTADTFGNHNFDGGVDALKKLIDGASYAFVSTNLKNVDAVLGPKVKKGYLMVEMAGVKVAILGITNEDAPTLTKPGALGGLEIEDPAIATSRVVKEAKAAGALVVVALAHMGATGKDGAGKPTGPLMTYAQAVKGDVNLVLGDHTDQIVNTTIDATTVVENRSKGRTYARIKIHVEKGVVSLIKPEIVDPIQTVTAALPCEAGPACKCPDVPCPDATFTCNAGKCQRDVVKGDPAAAALLQPYRDQLSVKYDEKIGTVDAEMVRNGTLERTGEAAIGDLVADAMLDRYKAQGAEIAITNGGGLRASLPSSYAPVDKTLRRTSAGYAAGPPFDLVVGDVFTVLPFGNTCVVRKVKGSVLWQALEKSVSAYPATSGGFLQIAGFKFSFSAAAAAGSRVTQVTLDGGKNVPSNDATEYTLVTNDFTSAGGDGYTMLIEPTPSPARDVLADVVLGYVKAKSPIVTPASGRITALP